MIHETLTNKFSVILDNEEPEYAKPSHQISLDFSDLLSSKTPQTPSNLSLYESGSVRADDDGHRLELLSMKSFSTIDALSPVDLQSDPEKNLTIGEIISKGSYKRRSKEAKKADAVNDITGKKRRKSVSQISEKRDQITKKEKLGKDECRKIVVQQTAELQCTPAIVLKDGKVEISYTSQKGVETKALEVVVPAKKKVTTSNSFKQVTHTEKWTEKETVKFYRALQLFGTDFSMIAKVFTKRNRNQIKNKFLREEKLNPEKVNQVFKQPNKVGFETLFKKFERYNKININIPSITAEKVETKVDITSQSSLLLPFQAPQSQIKLEDIQLAHRRRNESGSFHSISSIDSIDRAIMEDLSDILMPQKSLFGC